MARYDLWLAGLCQQRHCQSCCWRKLTWHKGILCWPHPREKLINLVEWHLVHPAFHLLLQRECSAVPYLSHQITGCGCLLHHTPFQGSCSRHHQHWVVQDQKIFGMRQEPSKQLGCCNLQSDHAFFAQQYPWQVPYTAYSWPCWSCAKWEFPGVKRILSLFWILSGLPEQHKSCLTGL